MCMLPVRHYSVLNILGFRLLSVQAHFHYLSGLPIHQRTCPDALSAQVSSRVFMPPKPFWLYISLYLQQVPNFVTVTPPKRLQAWCCGLVCRFVGGWSFAIARFEVKISYKKCFCGFFLFWMKILTWADCCVIEQYDLLLLEACACDTLPLLREEVIIVNKLLPQQWERHTCFQQ